jgi:hypothetical protein
VGAESGTPFNEFEFEDDVWVDYDEKVSSRLRARSSFISAEVLAMRQDKGTRRYLRDRK